MSAFDFCRRETIDIDTTVGVAKVPAWRYGDLALHRPVSAGAEWTITHLPTGCSMGRANCYFDNVERAAEAMAEISALRNEWASVDPRDRAGLGDLFEKVAAIGARFGGKDLAPDLRLPAERTDLNGYGAM